MSKVSQQSARGYTFAAGVNIAVWLGKIGGMFDQMVTDSD